MAETILQPGPWNPYFGFRIWEQSPDFSSEQRFAVQSFLDELSNKLDNGSYAFRFDDKGNLLCSKRNGDPDAASIGRGPEEAQNIIREFLLTLQLQPEPPSYQAFQKPSVRPRPSSGPSTEYQHMVAQFAALGQWWSERWEDGSMMYAICERQSSDVHEDFD